MQSPAKTSTQVSRASPAPKGEPTQQQRLASGSQQGVDPSTFNPSASVWKSKTAEEHKKKGPDASDNWRAQQGKPATSFKGNNNWNSRPSNANRSQNNSRSSNNQGNSRSNNGQGGNNRRNGNGNNFNSFNNNNNNTNNRNNNRNTNAPAAPKAEPIVLPTEGPLFDFLQTNEAPCFDAGFTETLQQLDCKVQLPTKWIFWSEPESLPGAPEPAPTREDYLKTLVQSKVISDLAGVRDYAFEACEKPTNAKILLFKQGIKPVWEDRGNYNGGRFFVACSSKTVAVNTFVTLIIKLLTGNVLANEELNGIAVSLQGSNKFAVQVWNRNSSEKDKIKTARKTMKKLFKKNVNYHVHRTSLKINKYGLDAVLPEIEKAEAEKAAVRAKELEKRQKVELVVIEPETKDTPEKEAPTEESIVDQMAKAAMAVALASAWENRAPQDAATEESH